MLRPIWVWQQDENGNAILDEHGERVPHKKAGRAKTEKDLTDSDRERMRVQLEEQERRNLANEKQARQEAFFEAVLKTKI